MADRRLLFLGDVHGEFEAMLAHLDRYEVRDADLVQVGDFGVGFGSPESELEQLESLDRSLAERGCTLYAIRGNHDNPASFAPGATLPTENVRLVPDYTLLELSGRRILCVGGAISLDRKGRILNYSWWANEGFRLDPAALARLDLSDLWAVVTHNAPDFAEPGNMVRPRAHYVRTYRDPTLPRDVQLERAAVTELHRLVMARATPQYWFYGHYHQYANVKIGDTTFVMVPELGSYSPPE
jgi:predicted phosphodiesterase